MLLLMNDLPDIRDTAGRLKFARTTRTKLKQKHVAERVGVTPQAVSQWERGEDSPSVDNLRKLADVYDVPMDWLSKRAGARITNDKPINAKRVPLISRVKAGLWSETWTPYEQGDAEKFFFTEVQVSDVSFALQIEGSSMEPGFVEGDVVIIDPRVAPLPGDFVVAKLASEDEATFKKYRPRGNSIVELVPLNPDWPTLTIDEGHPGVIVGTMIEHRRFRRK